MGKQNFKTFKMRILLFITFLMSTMMSSAQVLDKVIVVNNSYEVMTEHTFVDGDSLKFSVICDDVVNHNFEWEACIEIQDNSFMSLIKRHVTSNSFGFSVSPSLFTQSNIKRIEFQNDSCIYYHTKVFLYEDAVVLDSLSLHINVLPSKPKFVRLSLDGIFDYEDCCYNELAELRVSFTSNSMDQCYLAQIRSTEDSLYLNQIPNHYVLTYIPVTSVEEAYYHSIQYKNADWGQFYQIISQNKYGSVVSEEIIQTTDLIEDISIRDAVEHYYTPTFIKNVHPETLARCISYKNGVLYKTGSEGSVFSISIYDSKGQQVISSLISDLLDISFLPKGIYVIKCIDINKDSEITFKMSI